jgi:hypothetical protein
LKRNSISTLHKGSTEILKEAGPARECTVNNLLSDVDKKHFLHVLLDLVNLIVLDFRKANRAGNTLCFCENTVFPD